MTAPRYVDIHVIQTVPPSNLNRDDAGSPKQALYGGARRSRVSSQAWKRATRRYFADTTPEPERATRTLRIAKVLHDQLAERSELPDEAIDQITSILLKPFKVNEDKENKKKAGNTPYLLFFGRAQIERIVDQVVALAQTVTDLEGDDLESALAEVSVQDALNEGHPIDVALFGRMVADIPHLNVDAAVQVAHALSTHPVETEFDYFTAVDDEKSREGGDDAGAGMIGTVEFNSATLYRYATIGVQPLADNLDGDLNATASALRTFVEGFVRSIPTGHQNSFAHRTLPDAVLVVARDDQPVNLVSAFEEPVRTRTIAATSVKRLAGELKDSSERWGGAPIAILANYRALAGDDAEGASETLGRSVPFDDLLDSVEALIAQPAQVDA